jgi:hypothetical protein
MKGVRGLENQSKFNERLIGVRSRPYENQGTYFIFHSSFFIPAIGVIAIITGICRNEKRSLRCAL